jgi:hypothetical protein
MGQISRRQVVRGTAVTLRRLRSVCGLQAVLEATGQSFEELALQPQEKLALTET